MEKASSLRKEEKNSILASRIINKIREERENLSKDKKINDRKFIIYLVNQLKRPEEIELLNAVYEKSFIQLSVQDSEENRKIFLKKKLRVNHENGIKNQNDKNDENYSHLEGFFIEALDTQIAHLMEKDNKDTIESDSGQAVQKCFDKAALLHALRTTNTYHNRASRKIFIDFIQQIIHTANLC